MIGADLDTVDVRLILGWTHPYSVWIVLLNKSTRVNWDISYNFLMA